MQSAHYSKYQAFLHFPLSRFMFICIPEEDLVKLGFTSAK